MGGQPDARSLPTQKNADTHIHASSGVRTHDLSFRAVEAMKAYWGGGGIAPRIL
jgi:hypothetical protein